MARTCVAFSAEAMAALAPPRRSWSDVQRLAAFALQQFHHVAKHDACAWVIDQPFTDRDRRRTTLVTLYFGTDSAATKEEIAAFGKPFERYEEWSSDGVHERPDDAFPTLCVRRGELHQLWLEHTDPYMVQLQCAGVRTRRIERTFGQTQERDFLPHVKHSVGEYKPLEPGKARRRERLKIAFSHAIAQRIVEADGVIEDEEVAFLHRTFDEDLALYGLEDELERAKAVNEAESTLKEMLGHHEKLALLSTFFATCYSDGKLDVREIKVLKEASAALGVESKEVVAWLQKLW